MGVSSGLTKLPGKHVWVDYDQAAAVLYLSFMEGVCSEGLLELGEYLLDCDSFEDIQQWIQQRKQGNVS